MAALDQLIRHQIAGVAVGSGQQFARRVRHHRHADFVVAVDGRHIVEFANHHAHIQGGAAAVDHQRFGKFINVRVEQMGQRRRQALRHHLHIHDAEQLAFVQGDIAHQILALRFDALFVTLTVVRLVELGDR
ncbi:hypothetical protein D3C72_678180 [compost metagenome]